MACRIADNVPLQLLREELGLAAACHSRREACIHARLQQTGDAVLGASGAALGYCQALFCREPTAELQTSKVKQRLQHINAPWALSHELFWGYRQSEGPSEFVASGMRPIVGSGRVPILITGLDVAQANDDVRELLRVNASVPVGDSMLLRVVLKNDASVIAAVAIMRELLDVVRKNRLFPSIWPLFQGTITAPQWRVFKQKMGFDWRFVNVAINPFSTDAVINEISDQITVAQIVVGGPDGPDKDGNVVLPDGMPIMGASNGSSYSPIGFASLLRTHGLLPTLIVLGPSTPYWTDDDNQLRVAKMLPVLRGACEVVWGTIEASRRLEVMNLTA